MIDLKLLTETFNQNLKEASPTKKNPKHEKVWILMLRGVGGLDSVKKVYGTIELDKKEVYNLAHYIQSKLDSVTGSAQEFLSAAEGAVDYDQIDWNR